MRAFFIVDDGFIKGKNPLDHLQVQHSIFFCLSKRKRARGDFDFSPDLLEPTGKTPSVFLDFSREI